MPSVLVKSDFTFTTGEATARVRYNKFLTAGIGYRYNDAVTISLGAEIKGFYLGYAYDYATSAIAKASSGSHEIFAATRSSWISRKRTRINIRAYAYFKT